MADPDPTDHAAIVERAASHGLRICADRVRTVEAGLDYRVVFATVADGSKWVLRIPRRTDVSDKVDEEACILNLVRPRLSVAVPDWQIRSRDLIAYPLLPGHPGLTLNDNGEPQWHIDQNDPDYARELGRLIAELHDIDPDVARAAGVPVQTPEEVREEWRDRLRRVASSFDVKPDLLQTWNSWIADDALWPDTTVFTHGELYPAHVLVDESGGIRSVLDWTTAKVTDPAIDFMYHYMIASPEIFRIAVDAYTTAGGRDLPGLDARCAALLTAGPLTYADYALTTGDPEHAATAAAQLNP